MKIIRVCYVPTKLGKFKVTYYKNKCSDYINTEAIQVTAIYKGKEVYFNNKNYIKVHKESQVLEPSITSCRLERPVYDIILINRLRYFNVATISMIRNMSAYVDVVNKEIISKVNRTSLSITGGN